MGLFFLCLGGEFMIEFRNVTKTYDLNIKALNQLNLKIPQGKIFGIIGLSGAGKSTLIRTINGLEKIDTGEVLIKGVNIQNLSEKELLKTRQKIGIIFQHFNLLSQQTVLSNVILPLKIAGYDKAKAKVKALELLEMVGLSDKINAYPSQLSGGQQQRVAIARSLANDPDLLLVDEATSALDPQTTQSILNLLKQLHQQLDFTIVLITHEMSVIEAICDEVAILDQGQVVEVGSVSDIFKKPQSTIGRSLIYPSQQVKLASNELRITFDGTTRAEPIVASMVLETQSTVNIIHADMKTINKQNVGHLILQLPDDEKVIHRMCEFLTQHHIEFEKGE